MPVHNDLITLGTAAQLVVPNNNMEQEVHLHNMTLGNAEMTVSNSVHIDPGESIQINLGPGDELYALSDPAGLELGILRITQD